MKATLPIFILLVGFSNSFSQPVLTEANTQPAAGDMFDVKFTDYVSPGNPGINQTWDLSGLSINFSKNMLVVASSTTPDPSSFPGSNIAINELNGTYVYFIASSTGLELKGRDFGGGSKYILTDPEKLLQYPFNYGDSLTDTYSGTLTGGGSQTGTTSVTYDGCGTLFLPNGTYSNVARLHYYSNYINNGTDTFISNEYRWYLPGNHYYIAKLTSWEWVGVAPPSFTGEYLANIISGIHENTSSLHLNVFPNPASNQLLIETSNLHNREAIMKFYDSSGKLVMEEAVFINNKFLKIDIDNFSKGIYHYYLIQDDKLVSGKFVKQ